MSRDGTDKRRLLSSVWVSSGSPATVNDFVIDQDPALISESWK